MFMSRYKLQCRDTTYAIWPSVMSRDMLRCHVLGCFLPDPFCYCNSDSAVVTFLAIVTP